MSIFLAARGTVCDVGTVQDRLRWILVHRRAPDGSRWNPSKLARAAGLARSHINLVLAREKNDATLMFETAQKIAAVADVTATWLLTGEGKPEPGPPPVRTAELDARYPNLRAVIETFEGAYEPEFLEEFGRNALSSPVDLQKPMWRNMLMGAYATWRGKSAAPGVTVTPDDEEEALARGAAPKKGKRR